MKQIYLELFCIIFFSTQIYSQQWNLVSPFPEPYLQNVAVPDSIHLKGVNNKIFLRSDDGGLTWSTTSINYNARDFFFIDSLAGWIACDSSRMLRTIDGGLTWSLSHLPFPASINLFIRNLQFVNSDSGFCTGGQKLFFTHDGGTNWLSVSAGFHTWGYVSLRFKDSQHGWATCGGDTDIFKTVDGGQNWSVYHLPSPLRTSTQRNCLDFSDTLHGWIALQDDSILRTTDGGNAWQLVPSGFAYSSLNFFDSLTGFMNAGGVMYFTTDAGTSWNQCYIPANANAEYQIKLCQGEYYFSSNGNFFKSVDAYNWTRIATHNFRSFSAGNSQGFLKFNTKKTGVLVGGKHYIQQYDVNYNYVLFTNDSCQNWVGGGRSNWLSDFELTSDSIFYFTIYDDVSKWRIYKTTDGWHSDTLLTTTDGPAICFTNSLHGVCSEKYTIDGGLTWNPSIVTGGNSKFVDIVFNDLQNGWAIDNSSVFKTTDGGVNWTNIYSPGFQVSFKKIQFPGLMNGVILGNSVLSSTSLLFKTLDGGLTWDTISTPLDCSDFYFNNAMKGWATFLSVTPSQRGIYFTSDGGQTFTQQDNHFVYYLTFLDSVHGYAVGSDILLNSDQSGVLNFISEKGKFPVITIAPNPTSDEITISADERFYSLELYSAQGKLRVTKKINGQKYKLNVQNIESGVYVLKVNFKNDFVSKRIIILK